MELGHKQSRIEYSNLMEKLLAEGAVDNPCNGKGVCGKCRVKILTDIPEPTDIERKHLSDEELSSGIRLSCQVVPTEDMKIKLIHKERRQKILTSGYMPEFPFCTSPDIHELKAETVAGVAIDIGTTTLVCSLVDMRAGNELACTTAVNGQTRYGLDVITRITYELEHPEEGADKLRQALLSSVNGMVDQACSIAGIKNEDIYEITVSANTVMMHTLLGIDATSMGRAPYRPAFTEAKNLKADAVGIKANPAAMVYCLPAVSAFAGADVVAGAAVCDLINRKGNVLLVDIGTNGEMVLARDGRLTCCSCAAGPALEGMNISCGMSAADGAVSDIHIVDGEVKLTVVGDEEPSGICGSGILAAVREMINCSIVRPNGAYVKLDQLREDDYRRTLLRLDDAGRREFLVSEAAGIVITQQDIRQVQLAKGAILSGVTVLLENAGMEVKDLNEIIIAGQFGANISADILTGTGILPAEAADIITYAGNTSKAGAYMALMSTEVRRIMAELAEHMDYVELGTTQNYEDIYTQSLMFTV